MLFLRLLGSLGRELGSRLVAAFSGSDKLDFVARDLAFVDHLYRVAALAAKRLGKRNLISFDCSISDRGFPSRTSNRTRELRALGFECEGCFSGLTLPSRYLSNPLAVYARRPRHRNTG